MNMLVSPFDELLANLTDAQLRAELANRAGVNAPTAEEAWLALRSRDTPQGRDTIERFVCAAAGRICP